MKKYKAGMIYILHLGHCCPSYSMPTSSGSAKPPSSSKYSQLAPTVVAIVFVVAVIGFFTAYLCRCFLKHVLTILHYRRSQPSGSISAVEGAADMSDGLDPELIQAFPTFCYSSVENFRPEKYSLECAICLAEFSDDDMLRLLTICCHIFHKECIDHWLESRKTCPVCRTELDVPRKSIEKSPILVHSNSIEANPNSLQNSVYIDVKEDKNDKFDDLEDKAKGSSNTNEQHDIKRDTVERYSKSHSTGHSIARIREEEVDRHTLRLLDNVRIIIKRRHNSAGNCITFGEFTNDQ